jgi:hypothetical protein
MTALQPQVARDRIMHTGSPAEQVLAHAQAGREVGQEFTSLADTIEWLLGGEYLRQRGNKASFPIPRRCRTS